MEKYHFLYCSLDDYGYLLINADLLFPFAVVFPGDCFNRPPRKLRRGNVFSCVCLSAWGCPCDHYQSCIVPHWTVPPPRHCTSLYRDPLFPVHCTSLYRNPILWTLDLTVQGYPLLPTSLDICWLLKHVRSAQAGNTRRTGMLFCYK